MLLLLFSSWWGYTQQQLTAKVGETTTLSVNEVSNDTYVWELYDQIKGVNFATTSGNCPTEKAQFVSENTGVSVQVKWLQSGTYFYKVTAKNSCSNNIKIGKITIVNTQIPPPPKIVVLYNCDKGTAKLKATEYKGELLWSTGETTETIEVVKGGLYTLSQTINGQTSTLATVNIKGVKKPNKPKILVTPTTIELGDTAVLVAEGCEDGTLHWYSDKELTQEISNTTIKPTKTTTYYATCKNELDCESDYAEVLLTVISKRVVVFKAFTPNGDGKNDTFFIKGIENYPGNTLQIYNRWGNIVYATTNYDNTFKGISNGRATIERNKELPIGTYFYVLDLKDGKDPIKGWVYISR